MSYNQIQINSLLSDISDREVLGLFQSIGDDCELALMQRAVGVEKLHLLQWANITPIQLFQLLRARLEKFADPDMMGFHVGGDPEKPEYIMHDYVYGLLGHTWIYPTDPSAEKLIKGHVARMRFLRGKFLDDLYSGEYILVYKWLEYIEEKRIKEISKIIEGMGRGFLLWVSDAQTEGRSTGEVEWIGERSLRAYGRKFESPIWTFDQRGDFWLRICREALCLVTRRYQSWSPIVDLLSQKHVSSLTEHHDLAFRKKTEQSSVSEWSICSTPRQDSYGAVSGGVTGRAKFHTAFEHRPWWQVDLGGVSRINEIVVYNRIDPPGMADRAAGLIIEVGRSESQLAEVYRLPPGVTFGGADGKPLRFLPDFSLEGRYVRLRLPYSGCLHLDQVKVYGSSSVEKSYGIAIVACARWENRYLVEWMQYHKNIGADHIFLYCNDDDPVEMMSLVRKFFGHDGDFVTFIHHPVQGEQEEMYKNFLESYSKSCEWFGFLDIDEFVVLKRHNSIRKFLDTFGSHVSSVLFNWLFFGPNGHKIPSDVPVLEAFTRRQRHLDENTKFFVRGDAIQLENLDGSDSKLPFWHCPQALLDRAASVVNVIGEDVGTYFDGWPNGAREFLDRGERGDEILSTAVVHHYAFRSEQAFYERAARGVGGTFSGQGRWRELAESPEFRRYLDVLNEVEDRTLASFWEKSAMSRPELGDSDRKPETFADEVRCLTRGKRAWQSSVSRWSRFADRELDAVGAIDGVADGGYKFHTDLEDGPWWVVDLEEPVGIRAVRIFNRLDQVDVVGRASRLAIDVGVSADNFVEVYRRETNKPFGGVDGDPLVFKPTIPIPGRFVRVRLLTRNYLHLDQVEVYGEPLPFGFCQAQSAIVDAE